MSGGQKINDHSSWVGSRGKNSVLPDGVKHKLESSAEGAGAELDYEDTTEKIKAQQMLSKKKVLSHPMKPLFRN